jgi:orotidine-5'-phosphate decarboxylase
MTAFGERILASAERHGSRVVLALDLSGPYGGRVKGAEKVLGAVKEGIAAVKVNHHLLLPFGLEGLRGVVETCHREGLPLIADLKLNDIESTNLNAVDSLTDYGFGAVIANPFVGKDEGLGKVVERMHSRGGGVLLLVYMSHRGADEGFGLRAEGGDPLYRVFARRARDWKADGVVVSAKDPVKIGEVKGIVGKDCLVFSPGVGAQGGDAQSGVAAGADFVIVGRTIVEAADPAKALASVRQDLV